MNPKNIFQKLLFLLAQMVQGKYHYRITEAELYRLLLMKLSVP